MRIAWFSPLPPTRSGIAAYSADLVSLLGDRHAIDCFVDRPSHGLPAAAVYSAHDFVWRHQRQSYDLVIYQIGNAPYHDYIWAYVARYPGLVVLHDARLHHARARQLLSQKRFDDYRAEFRYGHGDAATDFVEYAVEGLGRSIYYFWSMLRAVVETARGVAVHNNRVADDLRAQYPSCRIETIRMGVPRVAPDTIARARIRRELLGADDGVVFGVFGKVTAEKRIDVILRAFAALAKVRADVALLLMGDAGDYRPLAETLERGGIGDRVSLRGHVADEDVATYLSATDICLCLRWPTAQETSASWLRCLAASRATVISDLAHLIDVPTLDPATLQPRQSWGAPVAISIDLADEDRSLARAMLQLADDRPLREALGRAGHAYWAANHTLEMMASDYLTVIDDVASRPPPVVRNLPDHFTKDYAEPARRLARRLGVDVDLFKQG